MAKILFLFVIVIYIAVSIILSKYLNYLILDNKIETDSYLTSKQIIEFILQKEKIFDVKIVESTQYNIDNYNTKDKSIYLSNDVYNSSLLSSKVIALHECGHAIQDNNNYFLLKLRQLCLPLFNLLNTFGILFILMGAIVSDLLFFIGLYTILISFVFQILTVQIEVNASSRIYKIVKNNNLLNETELNAMKYILATSAFCYIFSLFNLFSNLKYVFIQKNTKS